MSLVEKIFSCKRCGHCCQGETTVSLDEKDQERMVTSLGMKRAEVEQKFWRVTGNIVQMKIKDSHCVFYKDGCSIHEGRPWRCAQWPLHPSILADENNLISISESCPGINRKISYQDFCKLLKQIMKDSIIVC